MQPVIGGVLLFVHCSFLCLVAVESLRYKPNKHKPLARAVNEPDDTALHEQEHEHERVPTACVEARSTITLQREFGFCFDGDIDCVGCACCMRQRVSLYSNSTSLFENRSEFLPSHFVLL